MRAVCYLTGLISFCNHKSRIWHFSEHDLARTDTGHC